MLVILSLNRQIITAGCTFQCIIFCYKKICYNFNKSHSFEKNSWARATFETVKSCTFSRNLIFFKIIDCFTNYLASVVEINLEHKTMKNYGREKKGKHKLFIDSYSLFIFHYLFVCFFVSISMSVCLSLGVKQE